MRKDKEKNRQGDRLEFTGENCDRYVLFPRQIERFTIDGMDFKEFLRLGRKTFDRYELTLREPILLEIFPKTPFDGVFLPLYDYQDFVDLTVFLSGRKYSFDDIWTGGSGDWTLAQSATRKGISSFIPLIAIAGLPIFPRRKRRCTSCNICICRRTGR